MPGSQPELAADQVELGALRVGQRLAGIGRSQYAHEYAIGSSSISA